MMTNGYSGSNQTINYFIEKADYGLYVKFTGRLCKYDIKDWVVAVRPTVKDMKKNFSLILDLRGVKPICHDELACAGHVGRNQRWVALHHTP